MVATLPFVVRSPQLDVVLEFHVVVVAMGCTSSSTGVVVVWWKGAGTSSGAGLGWLDCGSGAGIGAGFPVGDGCK